MGTERTPAGTERTGVRAAVTARDRGQGRLRAVTLAIGAASVLAGGGLAYGLPGAAHAQSPVSSQTAGGRSGTSGSSDGGSSTSGSATSGTSGSKSGTSGSGTSGTSSSGTSSSGSGSSGSGTSGAGGLKGSTAPSSSSGSSQVTSGGS